MRLKYNVTFKFYKKIFNYKNIVKRLNKSQIIVQFSFY